MDPATHSFPTPQKQSYFDEGNIPSDDLPIQIPIIDKIQKQTVKIPVRKQKAYELKFTKTKPLTKQQYSKKTASSFNKSRSITRAKLNAKRHSILQWMTPNTETISDTKNNTNELIAEDSSQTLSDLKNKTDSFRTEDTDNNNHR